MLRTRNIKYYLASSVALATFILYLPALRNEFVNWDDGPYVFANFHIRSFDIAFFKWSFFDFYSSNWHPLTWISHALDYALWDLNPLGHHLTNIIIHAANTFVVVLLIRRLLEVLKERTTESRSSEFLSERTVLITSGVTGLLFGLHPVHVESVAWVAERKDLLCAFFFLLSIIMYTSYVRRRKADSRWLSEDSANDEAFLKHIFINKHYLLSLVLFILSLTSKPMAVTLPVVLLVLDWYPFSRLKSRQEIPVVFFEKLPFIVLSFASSVLTILAQKSGDTLSSLDAVPVSTRLLVAGRSLIAYLEKMLLPHNLIPLYPYPKDVSLFSFEYISAIILVISITVACLLYVRKQKVWLSAWGYYIVSLLPVLGIVQVGNQAMADRYTYLPSLGPFLIAGICTAGLSEKIHSRKRGGVLIKAMSVAVTLLFVCLPILTVKQIAVWRNSTGLWTYVIDEEPEKIPLMYVNRGAAFQKQGLLDKAIADYKIAIELDPYAYRAYISLGAVLEQMGQFEGAKEALDKAIALNHSSHEAYRNRGILYEDIGRFSDAIADYTSAITLKPSYYEAYNNRGLVFGKIGQLEKAIADYNETIRINPLHFGAYENRAVAYTLTGRYDQALEDFNRAIRLGQDDSTAYFNRGMFYRRTGNNELALLDIRMACDLGNERACSVLHQSTKGFKTLIKPSL